MSNLQYVNEKGILVRGLDSQGEPIRGGGTGFEQDLLIFERAKGGDTTIIPRVIGEVKLGQISTHDAITYSEKARRIRVIYPYVRYGLLLGGLASVPGRALRLGQEFDFIVVLGKPPSQEELDHLGDLMGREVRASQDLGLALSGGRRVKELERAFRVLFE